MVQTLRETSVILVVLETTGVPVCYPYGVRETAGTTVCSLLMMRDTAGVFVCYPYGVRKTAGTTVCCPYGERNSYVTRVLT